MLKWIAMIFVFALVGCATEQEPVTEAYIQAIDAYSAGEVQYLGAYNNLQYRATIMNSAIQQTVIEKKGEVYKWDPIKKQNELAKLQADNGAKTKVFLSFFTPSRLDDNLASKKTIWSVYLETALGRYEGIVTRNRVSLTELAVLYPYHTRFTSAYDVEFPVALNSVETAEAKMIITGPLGAKDIIFPAKK